MVSTSVFIHVIEIDNIQLYVPLELQREEENQRNAETWHPRGESTVISQYQQGIGSWIPPTLQMLKSLL